MPNKGSSAVKVEEYGVEVEESMRLRLRRA